MNTKHFSIQPAPQELLALLEKSRARTLALALDLTPEQLLGPKLEIVNPPLWEIGHVGWFQEHWCLRWRGDGTLGPSILPNADQLYDSSNVAHDTRWDLPLPNLATTRAYLASVLEKTLECLAREPEDERPRYFVRLCTLHEDMHAEALHYTHQTLGYPEPEFGVRTAIIYRPDPELIVALTPNSDRLIIS